MESTGYILPMVAVLLDHGRGVDLDYKAAFAWFRQAAMQGHREAQYFMGLCYEIAYCYGVQPNQISAKEWYLKAAVQGHERARNRYYWFKSRESLMRKH